ncbi:hypothetical protein ACPOL_2629 [Acidisarcina polymorpha]|uniref:Carboxypeptidase regulatory-like domain-containing protein n=1 Tax=Acidisarcina polymorpha TaxID=2211140 RepID=A0A2Z5FZX0_9BACT|nr:carboxypeptidase-like regulatory domain-containing protein [Acidisarcina polymorpha]AXC11945.1 hypothetical protein ACPOL_2629 [Acidisarcina polymorpha]
MHRHISSGMKGALLLALMFAVFQIHAQEFRAVLTGQVSDPSGALIQNATIAAVNVNRGPPTPPNRAAKATTTSRTCFPALTP